MKKILAFTLILSLLFALVSCGAKQEDAAAPADSAAESAAEESTEPAPAETETPAAAEKTGGWTREGYFSAGDDTMVSITYMDDIDEPGWYVGVMIGDIMGGNTLAEEGDTLHGDLNAWDESADPLIVTVSEEGEDGIRFEIEGGETYHLTRIELPEATIFTNINIEGFGCIGYAEGSEAPELDLDEPYQSAVINLAEPAEYTIAAMPEVGSVFVKWTKNGEDFTTEPQFTVTLDESADYVAIFEEDPDWQNPVMNFIGAYQCDRAHASIECSGASDAWIMIDWAGSATEEAHWDIYGRLDLDTLTIPYSNSTKQIIVYGEDGEVTSQEVEYDDGSGTIVFNDDGTFTWHDDKSETGEDMVFEWVPVVLEEEEPEE